MKKCVFQRLAFLLFSFLFYVSCETEPVQMDLVQDAQQSNVLVEEVDFGSIPELSEALNSTGKSKLARSYAEKGDSKFWIDENSVLKLKDSVNNESFSVIIHSDDPSPKTFYNLVVTKRTDGNPIVPFVVEYNFDNGDISSFASDEEKNFDGTVNIYSLEEFAGVTGLNARDTQSVACFEDVGQPNTTTTNNTSSGSPGAPSGAPSSTTTPSSPKTVSARPHISVTRTYTKKGTVTVGQGRFYMPPMTSNKQDQKSSVLTGKDNNPCPEGWVSVPINEIKVFADPSCESFRFYKVGNTGVQVAAVDGIWDVVTKLDRCPGLGVAASYQTYYFHVPARWNSFYASERAADALAGAFFDLQKWFRKQSCGQINTGVLAIKMDEFIKENFKKIGGQATRNAPLGWSGSPRPYKEDWMGTDDCY
ncbi:MULTISPECIES: hypothetical protein [Flavobacteriaceae]|uniref:hypothetical protein n=1 Tax=Flavobacteriaceae TaxID=49546 RepID=UPI0014922E8C|nr:MULTISPECIES: hypothetical protein [Allomuricauda]MDC6366454.1 hypothetical protein [Muricauda sp. AC10]